MKAHTPGPWVVGEGLRGYEFGVVKKIPMAEIGIADIPEGVHVGEAFANACAIAAVPDMIAALKAVVSDVDVEQGADVSPDAMVLVRAALAKVETAAMFERLAEGSS